jgi:hypothetical protein
VQLPIPPSSTPNGKIARTDYLAGRRRSSPPVTRTQEPKSRLPRPLRYADLLISIRRQRQPNSESKSTRAIRLYTGSGGGCGASLVGPVNAWTGLETGALSPSVATAYRNGPPRNGQRWSSTAGCSCRRRVAWSWPGTAGRPVRPAALVAIHSTDPLIQPKADIASPTSPRRSLVMIQSVWRHCRAPTPRDSQTSKSGDVGFDRLPPAA